MSKATLILFGDNAELLSFLQSDTAELEIEISHGKDGYIRLGEVTALLRQGKCKFDTKCLPDGEYQPILTVSEGEIMLPRMICKGGIASPVPVDDGFVRELSIRNRALARRVKALEERLEQISKAVYGSTIF